MLSDKESRTLSNAYANVIDANGNLKILRHWLGKNESDRIKDTLTKEINTLEDALKLMDELFKGDADK
ncbi:hypothetical protein YK48G_17310 [Lentilactobacillus fungorum]|uniref:Uncharacterized protein n=1 Tax=Lentilactobacillus fungorum TaxID=2201250 RepID=A0ABQ3W1Y8_9LACO|nr:hypothetical protein [Lentilactobacillus fungorum]GHP14306.1 hypothetical protein YK48G_17310 [Lentilactobacillus fungorum]